MGPRRATAEHCAQSRLVRSRSRIMPRPATKQMLLTKHITPIETPPLLLWGLIQSQDGGEQPLFSASPTYIHTHTQLQSIRHADKGGRAAASGKQHEPQGGHGLVFTHKLMKHTFGTCVTPQNTEALK